MNKIERMKITGVILLFLFNLLGVVPSMGQTQEEKVYSKIDLMYNVLNQKDRQHFLQKSIVNVLMRLI